METNQKIEETHKYITNPLKRKFLTRYKELINTRQTAREVRVSESTVYRWLREDELFTKTFTEIKKENEGHIIELHEQNIDNLAFDPKTKDQSRIFGSLVRLRALAPDKYREKPQEHKLAGDITFKLATPDYDDSLRKVPVLPKGKEDSPQIEPIEHQNSQIPDTTDNKEDKET